MVDQLFDQLVGLHWVRLVGLKGLGVEWVFLVEQLVGLGWVALGLLGCIGLDYVGRLV